MKKSKKIWYGWAFKFNPSDFCGIYFWGETPPWINAIKTAVFRTRAEARRHKNRTLKRKIVPVKVTIREQEIRENILKKE